MKNLLISVILFLAVRAGAQQNFQATANSAILSNHAADTRVSTTTDSGFISPATLTFVHVQGKDFNINPDLGVNGLGNVQFGTGSFLSGSLSGTALFDVDQSFVIVGTNGYCGQFNAMGVCKPGGFVPNSTSTFVGVFEGTVTWQTCVGGLPVSQCAGVPDNAHVIKGTVKGLVLGAGPNVFLSFTAVTAPDTNPFVGNGHLNVVSIQIVPFV